MIWLGVIILAACAVALFWVRGYESDSASDPVALYRKQLADLQQDKTIGILDHESAESARLEIERRILRLEQPTTQGITPEKTILPTGFAVAAIVGAIGLYAFLGTPHLVSAPGKTIRMQDTPVEEGGPSFRDAITKVQAHLAENPNDIKGWEILAKSARSISDFSLAVKAFERLSSLDPDGSHWRVQQLEAYIAMANGQVTPAANLVLQTIIAQHPNHPAAQYYRGLGYMQTGDEHRAKQIWTELANNSPAEAPWMEALNKKLVSLGVRPPKLTKEQMAVVSDMTTEDRAAFISTMIDRLKAKLDSAPNDSEGWLMLARSQLVTEGKETAIATLHKGLTHISGQQSVKLQAFLDKLTSNPDP